MTAGSAANSPIRYCDDGLRLRYKVQKLRWMGLEREADQLAHIVSRLRCGLPHAVPSVERSTD